MIYSPRYLNDEEMVSCSIMCSTRYLIPSLYIPYILRELSIRLSPFILHGVEKGLYFMKDLPIGDKNNIVRNTSVKVVLYM
jgi:hypothetical protein